MSVITRFAPSPTGFLHIGGARTALFNWLFAKRHNGTFLLRIEDTDKERSSQEALDAIIQSMRWLELDVNDEIIYQSRNHARHKEIAYKLLESGKAYKCYSSSEEIAEFKAQYPGKKFQSPWRESDITPQKGTPYSIRIKAPLAGSSTIEDLIQGSVKVENTQLDDMIILRSNSTATYMLAAAVDDHDMGITHIIRGDDHLNNAFRQQIIFDAMGWQTPIFAHIPLIHGDDGSKLSKRHGALGVHEYQGDGYIPEAMLSYLLRMGWNPGHDDIISAHDAIPLFDISKVGKSPARFDVKKLNNINNYYMKHKSPKELWQLVADKLPDSELIQQRIISGMNGIIERSDTLNDLIRIAQIYVQKSNTPDEKSLNIVKDHGHLIPSLIDVAQNIKIWKSEDIKTSYKDFIKQHNIKFPTVMQLLRASVLGTFEAPPIFEVMSIIGQEESINRMMQNTIQ